MHISCLLTYNAQIESLADFRFGRDLAFVYPAIPNLRRANLQGPFVTSVAVQRLETLVVRVR